MGYRVVPKQEEFGPRKGLEGPFPFGNGRILYYDPREGQYWDPRTDFYVPNDEVADLQQTMIDRLKA